MLSKKSVITLLILTLSLLNAPLFAAEEKAEEEVDTFTNLFEEETIEGSDKLKKRSHENLFDTGNKIGYKMSYQYVFQGQPGMNFTFFVDIPFHERWSVCIEGGPSFARITSFKDRLGNKYPDDFMGANTNEGEGKYVFVAISGTLRFFIRAFWLSTGFNYAYFAFGGLNYIDAANNNIYRSITRDDGAKDMFSVLASIGYLAELKQNVFVAPEIRAGYNFVEGSALSKKVILNCGFALLFKL
ncbi:MAG TPA: hypothetical protein VKS21_08270 [Spirochaetota bacterium]|nr:hypothetical protein [Spirochaetota bacterium]